MRGPSCVHTATRPNTLPASRLRHLLYASSSTSLMVVGGAPEDQCRHRHRPLVACSDVLPAVVTAHDALLLVGGSSVLRGIRGRQGPCACDGLPNGPMSRDHRDLRLYTDSI